MTSANTLQDRRQHAENLLSSIANADNEKRVTTLRALAAQCLGLTAVNWPDFAVNDTNLPGSAAVIAEMPNDYGPPILAVHFDLTDIESAGRDRVTTAQAQAANTALQQQAGAERTPLLIFTLPDDSGIQFIYGIPVPGSIRRLQSIQRLTYHWGEPNRTTLDALERIGQEIASGHDAVTSDEKAPQTALQDGFNVQPVTAAFFQDYKAAYQAATTALQTKLPTAAANEFAQTLFNRLLFVHFVSRKGWLTFNGKSDYLNALWADYQNQPEQTNFYADRLAPLFHEGMNTPEKERNFNIAARIGQVPYLNGGLFEKNALDQQGIAVDDLTIVELLGINGLFNRYNFTVTEATPLDTEVAVDPEMLGKLFEETVNERHSNGAYYTPRPVVAFMGREALKGYLAGQTIPGLTANQISDLVDNHNAAAINLDQAIAIAQALAAAKILDPACGSGAFLLGMLQEIIALNESLFRAGATPSLLYQQKLDIISHNLHGADKDPAAVSIAMLRLWLSLSVDYTGTGLPPTLPNLDLKLTAGDALTGPNPQLGDLIRMSIINSGLQQDIAAYTTAHGPPKEALKQRVATVQAQLREQMKDAAPPSAIEWRIDFAPVVMNGGFDIVIANPPYVRQEEITPKAYKDALLKAYAGTAVGRSDLYCYFYARALQLLKPGGMQVFVCSNSWLDVAYGAKLQEYLLDNATVEAIYESAVERQFSTAAINTVISILRAGPAGASHETRFIRLLEDFAAAVQPAGQKRIIVKTAAELRAAGTDPDQRKPAGKSGKGGSSGYVGDKWGGKYLRAPAIYHHILNKYGDKLVRLGDIATVRFGLKTGANEFFYLKPERIKELGIEPEFLAPVMTSPTESRSLIVNPATLPYQVFMCHKDREELKGTAALAYIEWAERNHNWHTRSSTARGRRNWYDLGERTPPPIAMNRIIDARTKAFTLPPGTYADATLQEVHADPERAAALAESLNDDFAQVQYNIEGRANFGGGALELKIYETERILVENPNIISGGGGYRIHPGGTPGPGGGFEGTGELPAAAGEVGVEPAIIGFGPLMRTKCPFLIPPAGVHLDKRLYYLYLPEELLPPAATVLNSTVVMLLLQYAGRANMSGIIELATYETSLLPIPNPWGIAAPGLEILDAADYGLVTRDRRTESGFRMTLTATRRQIDEPVFAWLGLTQDEQDEVYNATYEAIVNRQIAEANVV